MINVENILITRIFFIKNTDTPLHTHPLIGVILVRYGFVINNKSKNINTRLKVLVQEVQF